VLAAPSVPVDPPVALPPLPEPSMLADIEPSTPADPVGLPPAPPVRPGVPLTAGASSASPPVPPTAFPPSPPISVPLIPPAPPEPSDLAAPSGKNSVADFPQPLMARNTQMVPAMRIWVARHDCIWKSINRNARSVQPANASGVAFRLFEAAEVTLRGAKLAQLLLPNSGVLGADVANARPVRVE